MQRVRVPIGVPGGWFPVENEGRWGGWGVGWGQAKELASQCANVCQNYSNHVANYPYNPADHLKKCRSPGQEKCRKSASESAGPKRGAEEGAEKSAPGPVAYTTST